MSMKLYMGDRLSSRKLICRCIYCRHNPGTIRQTIQRKLHKQARQDSKKSIQRELLAFRADEEKQFQEFLEMSNDIQADIQYMFWDNEPRPSELFEEDSCHCHECDDYEERDSWFDDSSSDYGEDNYTDETWMGYTSVDSPESDVPFQRVDPKNINHHTASSSEDEEFPLFV